MRSNGEDARADRGHRAQILFGVGAFTVLGTAAAMVTVAHVQEETRHQAQPVRPPAREAGSPAMPAALGTEGGRLIVGTARQDRGDTRTREERIRDVREYAAKHTTKISRPLVPQDAGRHVAEAELRSVVTEDRGETRRLYSARRDLTGQKELAWVTGDYDRIGDVNCTRKIRLSRDVPARERPTLLICWRVSEGKSVYSVAVDPDGRPSEKRSVAAVEKEWARMA